MADDNFEEDIFDDLYDEEPASKPAAAAPAAKPDPVPAPAAPASVPAPDTNQASGQDAVHGWQAPPGQGDANVDNSGYNAGGDEHAGDAPMEDDNYGPINVKEDG